MSNEPMINRKRKRFYEFFTRKKLLIIILVLAVYLVILSLIFVPLQGGLISSTELNPPTGQQDTSEIGSTLGAYVSSVLIAFFMLSHTLLANLQLGGSWIAVATESFYLKNNKARFKRIARSVTLLNVMLFSLGTTFATAGVVFFIVFTPSLTTNLFHIFFWPLLIEAILFATQIAFLFIYWFSWDKIKPKWHQTIGYGFCFSVFIQTLMITMVGAAMLTPGESSIDYSGNGTFTMDIGTLLAWWFNPTTLTLMIHRLFGAISFVGFILAMLAMFHYKDQKDLASKKYWDWIGSYGIAWGLFGLIFQPIFGMINSLAIQDASPGAFSMIMQGPRAWEMLLMVSLLSALFLTVIVYFIDRREQILTREEYATIRKLFNIFLIVAAICAFIVVQPSWLFGTYSTDPTSWINPFGLMILKYPAIFTLVIIGALVLMINTIMLGDIKESEWGNLTNTSRYAGILTGIFGMWIIITMGYVRESARAPDLIYGIISMPNTTNNLTPIPIDRIFIVWGLILLTIIIVFWITSKVTAHHPESAEELDSTKEYAIEEDVMQDAGTLLEKTGGKDNDKQD